jgi:hypothetical protein
MESKIPEDNDDNAQEGSFENELEVPQPVLAPKEDS